MSCAHIRLFLHPRVRNLPNSDSFRGLGLLNVLSKMSTILLR